MGRDPMYRYREGDVKGRMAGWMEAGMEGSIYGMREWKEWVN